MPAILEYLPYRKRDGTARARRADATPISPATATPASASTCAAAASRTAMLLDEYLKQEQDDALEVMDWIAGAALVQRRGRHDRHLLGRVQRPAGRGAPAAGS